MLQLSRETSIQDSVVQPFALLSQNVLVARRGEFVTTVTAKLLTYALGRGVEYYDRPAIRAIVREAELGDYRWSSLILGVARSQPFQMRRSER